MMASVFLSRVMGVFREMVIAYIGGVGGSVDAYQVAFIIPEILNHISASGFLSVTFIPIFARYLSENKESEGWEVFSIVLIGFGSLLVLLIITALIFAPQLVSLLAPGLTDPVRQETAIRMTRIIIPAQLFFFIGAMLMSVQFAKEKFFLPALSPLLYNLGIIGGGLLLGKHIGMEGFSWGVLAGAFIGNILVQYYGARKVGMRLSFAFNLKHPDFIKYVKLTLPLMVGLTMISSTEVLFRFFGSFLRTGSVASLNYSFRVIMMLAGLFGQAAGVAATPFLSRLAVEKRFRELNDLLNTALRYLALVIPFSFLFMVLRNEVILILFQRGEFTSTATTETAKALLFMLIGAFGFSAQMVAVRGFYAMKQTLLPTIIVTIAVLISIPFYALGSRYFGISGIAMAMSLSAILMFLLPYLVWNKRSGNTDGKGVLVFYSQMILLGIGFGVVLEWLKINIYGYIDADTFAGSAAVCLILGSAFTAMLIAAGYMFKISEIHDGLSRLISRKKTD
ncbi:MAG: murein biosynthesis integral membrane protein MurJ [Deltaproteobacteria bacterium]|nr:murein biosynthesis integral membrane protein MurJ [Deltaproteobacteria bacterium]MBW2180975.1 murein biosynthesis integral membrane protein MurJ [Deltaproteobacteria bacterium]